MISKRFLDPLLRHLAALLFACFCIFPVNGCSDSLETIALEINGITFTVEVARTTAEQQQGLMYRKRMRPDHGMLFPYGSDRRLSFWMKNTLIPLSIAFISSDGVIKEIYEMNPLSLRDVVSRQSVRYALEVNQGIFEVNDIKPGDTVVFPEDFK